LKSIVCPKCGGRVVRSGHHVNLHDVAQQWDCVVCGTSFTTRLGYFPRGKFPAAAVLYAVNRYFSHPTLQQVKEELDKIGVHVSRQTILHWVQRSRRTWHGKMRLDKQRYPMRKEEARALKRLLASEKVLIVG